MKVLFVYSQYRSQGLLKPLTDSGQINFGLAYLASFLEKHGHEVRMAVLSSNIASESIELMEEITAEYQPEVLGLHAVSSEYPFIVKVGEYVAEHYPDIYQVIGGPHVTLEPVDSIENGPWDAICTGEGEHALLEMVRQVEDGGKPSGIANMWIRTSDGIEKNGNNPFDEKLDSIPFPNRDIWFDWIEDPEHWIGILLGRGCPFLCTYCANHALMAIAEGKYTRFRSADNIIDEIRYLHERYPNKRNFWFEVETFNVHKDWVFELCDKLEAYNNTLATPLEFGTNYRVGGKTDYDRIFEAFSRANITSITVGFESGSERVRREVLKRNYSNDAMLEMVTSARKHGLHIGFQNMIGLPGETEEEFMETVRMNQICQPDGYALSIFYPYPGTNLYHVCEEMGLLEGPIDTRMERVIPVLEIPTFPTHRILKRCIWFYYDVYKGHKKFIVLLLGLLRAKLLYSYPIMYNRINNIPILRDAIGFLP